RNRWRGRLSAGDQSRFDSYYTRWLQYRRDNNREQISSMEKRMWDLMDHNNIPREVPFGEIASRRERRVCFRIYRSRLVSARTGTQSFFDRAPPPRRMPSSALGPATRKISANAMAPSASGN